MINFRSENGSAFVVVIIVAAIAILGALGFIYWQNYIQEPVAKVETSTTTETNEPGSETPAPTNFAVSEYGVEFVVPAALEDTTVTYEARQIGEASFLAFTTQRAVDLGGDCAKGYPFGDLVTLSRNDQSVSSEYDVFTTEKIGDYYYHVGTVKSSGLMPASTCPDDAQANEDLKALVIAFNSLKLQN